MLINSVIGLVNKLPGVEIEKLEREPEQTDTPVLTQEQKDA